jgi:hypothetical protein
MLNLTKAPLITTHTHTLTHINNKALNVVTRETLLSHELKCHEQITGYFEIIS